MEGVKILGGNPSEEQAKAAAKTQREMKEKNPGMSYSEIAKATGTSRQAAHKACQPKEIKSQVVDRIKTPVIDLSRDPSRTAASKI